MREIAIKALSARPRHFVRSLRLIRRQRSMRFNHRLCTWSVEMAKTVGLCLGVHVAAAR